MKWEVPWLRKVQYRKLHQILGLVRYRNITFNYLIDASYDGLKKQLIDAQFTTLV